MNWSAAGAIAIIRDSYVGTCLTLCTCSKSLLSISVVDQYAGESVYTSWRFFPGTHSRTIAPVKHVDAILVEEVGFKNDVHIGRPSLIEFFQTPHGREHFCLDLFVSCFSVR